MRERLTGFLCWLSILKRRRLANRVDDICDVEPQKPGRE